MTQTTVKNSKRRKGLAIGVATVAALGLGLGAATQLNLLWDGNFQAGATVVDADCQPETKVIGVGFSDPVFSAAATLPWTIADIEFSNVDAACEGLSYDTAIKLDGSTNWVQLESGTVALTSGGFTVDTGSHDVQEITDIALTING